MISGTLIATRKAYDPIFALALVSFERIDHLRDIAQ